MVIHDGFQEIYDKENGEEERDPVLITNMFGKLFSFFFIVREIYGGEL